MSIELGRRLVASELVTRENVRDALLLSEQRGISLPRALVEQGIVTEAALDDEIARLAGSGLRYVQGSVELVVKLPRTMTRRLSALPTRKDPQTGTVDIAAADPFDPHVEMEMSFHLKAPVRVVRASMRAVEEAIRRIEVATDGAPADAANRPRRLTPALPYGAPGSVPPPAPSTPIPLVVKRSPNSVSLDEADTYVDGLDPNETDDLGRTAGWGVEFPTIPDLEDPISFERTTVRGLAAAIPPLAGAAAAANTDESASLARTAAWGAPETVRAAETVDRDPDELASLTRTAAWGPPARVATVAPAQRLTRTLDFDEGPPRVSAPRAVDSVPPSHGFAPPEVSAWKDLANGPPSRDVVPETQASPTNLARIEDDLDIETTFVSEPEDLPQPLPPLAGVETISLTSIPEALPTQAADVAPASTFHDDFNAPERPTLIDFPPQPSAGDAKSIIASMAEVTNRDAIVDLAFRCMGLFAHRVALFSAKRNGFYGWMCNEAFGSPDALRQIVIPNNQPSIMATAAATSIYLGPIPRTSVHEPLLAAMGEASGDVAVASVRVGGKVAAILVCDELRDTLSSTRRMDELARAMGDALTRLVKARG